METVYSHTNNTPSLVDNCLQMKKYLLTDYSEEYILKKYTQYTQQENVIINMYEKLFSKEHFQNILVQLIQIDQTFLNNANLGFFVFMILEDKAFQHHVNIKFRAKRIQILNYILSTSAYYTYLYPCSDDQTQLMDGGFYKFFSRLFDYYELFQNVIHLFQYNFNKDCGYKKYKQVFQQYSHFQFIVDIFKYIIAINPSDPTKVLNSYSEILPEEVLTNIFYKRYYLLMDENLKQINLKSINLYDAIIDYPCLIHNHLVNVYQECIQFNRYVLKYVQIYKPLDNILIISELFQTQDYCLQCSYDIIKEDIVQFDCGHQFCQSCFISIFLKEDISYLTIVACPWCKKETKHVQVPTIEDKLFLLRQLPTETCLKYVFKKVSSKKIRQQTDILCLNLLSYKYDLQTKRIRQNSHLKMVEGFTNLETHE